MDQQWVDKQQDEAFGERFFNFLTEVFTAFDELIRVVEKEKEDSKYTQS